MNVEATRVEYLAENLEHICFIERKIVVCKLSGGDHEV